MGKAEVRKGAGLRKSMRIDEAGIVKSSLVAVCIIRGTKLAVSSARIAAGDAVVIAGPGPAHRVAHRDADAVRHKHEAALPDSYIYNLTSTRWHAAYGWSAVLIYNANGMSGGMLLLRYRDESVMRISLRRKYECKHRGQRKNQSYYCSQ